ncbi:hypothetical protein BJV78DRAFT_1239209 [Lactifluus subvellereus]|nr:hypothetical protein BJV78DRAFT_1239209 [Lactifluus subvellereus]
MNFWDAPLAAASPGTSTPPPQTAEHAPPSLNEEVTEVIGQLGRFWGGFRKQSQNAIQAARKDLGDYVSQAQDGLNKQFATVSVSSPAPASDTDTHPPDASSSHDLTDATATDGESSASSSTSASTASLPEPQRQRQQEELPQSPGSQTLFTRLQSSLSPDLLSTLRDTIPDSVRHAQGRMDLAQATQAMHGAAARGEELLRGASVFLRDAVRVVPPEQAAASSSTPTSTPTPPAHEGAVTPRPEAPTPASTAATSVTRRDALLHALRATPAILRVDPAREERSAGLFVSWTKAGAGAAHDETRHEAELAADDGALLNTRSTLVPEVLSEDDFWTRYFFRVYQINQEDERRKAVLEGATEQEDDFNWEDEDEEVALKGGPSSPPPVVPVLNRVKVPPTATSGATSPQRSDDSFDFVSSGHTSVTGDASAAHAKAKEISDGDNDGEEQGSEGDEDEDESDWE